MRRSAWEAFAPDVAVLVQQRRPQRRCGLLRSRADAGQRQGGVAAQELVLVVHDARQGRDRLRGELPGGAQGVRRLPTDQDRLVVQRLDQRGDRIRCRRTHVCQGLHRHAPDVRAGISARLHEGGHGASPDGAEAVAGVSPNGLRLVPERIHQRSQGSLSHRPQPVRRLQAGGLRVHPQVVDQAANLTAAAIAAGVSVAGSAVPAPHLAPHGVAPAAALRDPLPLPAVPARLLGLLHP